MTQTEFEQFRVKIEQDYVKLLDLLNRVLGTEDHSPVLYDDKERVLIARGLTDKFINHAVTILHLSRGIEVVLPSFKFDLDDFASIDVLTRTSLEAFLTFHYVFYAPKAKEEKDYRYWAYKAAGVIERQDAPASTEENKWKKAEEKRELNKLRQQLEANVVFQDLTSNQKKLILKGRWRLQSWREIAIDAGFSKAIASHMYGLFSGRAHSSFLSVIQSVDIQINKGQREDISHSMSVMNSIMASMIREYCGLFPKAQEVLNKDSHGSGVVEWWIQIDRVLDEFSK